MKNISKHIGLLVLSVILFQVFSLEAFALSLSSSFGTKTPNTTETLTLTAVPQTGENGVNIDLIFTNITVLNFTANPDSEFITLPACSGNTSYTASSVCVTIVKTTNLVAGDSLGTIEIRWGSAGTASIVATDNNIYLTSTGQRVDSGNKGTYTIEDLSSSTVTPTPTSTTNTPTPTIANLPRTPFSEKDVDQYFLISIGIFFIFIGFYLRKNIKIHSE